MWWFLFILYLISIAMFGSCAPVDVDESDGYLEIIGKLIIVAITPLIVIPYIIYLLLFEKPIKKIEKYLFKKEVVKVRRTVRRKKRGKRGPKKNRKRRI